MDTRSGRIGMLDDMRDEVPDEYLLEIEEKNLTEAARMDFAKTGSAKVGRNDSCPCGSGSKFKRCCLGRRVESKRQRFASADRLSG